MPKENNEERKAQAARQVAAHEAEDKIIADEQARRAAMSPDERAAANRKRVEEGRPAAQTSRQQWGAEDETVPDGNVDKKTQRNFGYPTWKDAIEAQKKEKKEGKGH